MAPVDHQDRGVLVPTGPDPMRNRLDSAHDRVYDANMDDETHAIPNVDEPLEKPVVRRMSLEDEQKKRRESIKAIMKDPAMSESERRLSVQLLMDGRRMSGGGASSASNMDEESVGCGCSSAGIPPLVLLSNGLPGESFTCVPVSNEQTKLAEKTRPDCSHYERKCSIISPCCGAAFGCRICHDDCPILPPKQLLPATNRRAMLAKTKSTFLPNVFDSMHATPEDNHHTIDRFAIKEVICRDCFTRQSSKSNKCVTCFAQFGRYHCESCNLWMSDEEAPYHCEECGFCRVGGAENYRHCHDCGMCIDQKLYENHNCKVGKYKSNCPVCQEYLFSSRLPSHELPCGHAIHWECFRQLAVHDSRCPVCKKTAETKERMQPTWEAMANAIDLQPIPPELARVVNISCNDCEKSDDARAWHFLGVQCRSCSSFNTAVDRIVLTGEEAHEFLEAVAQRSELLDVMDSSHPRRHQRVVSRRRSHV